MLRRRQRWRLLQWQPRQCGRRRGGRSAAGAWSPVESGWAPVASPPLVSPSCSRSPSVAAADSDVAPLTASSRPTRAGGGGGDSTTPAAAAVAAARRRLGPTPTSRCQVSARRRRPGRSAAGKSGGRPAAGNLKARLQRVPSRRGVTAGAAVRQTQTQARARGSVVAQTCRKVHRKPLRGPSLVQAALARRLPGWADWLRAPTRVRLSIRVHLHGSSRGS